MEKVYLVSRGCYSDFNIVCAFSTEDKAQAFIDSRNQFLGKYEHYNDRLDCFIVDDQDKPFPENGYAFARLYMSRDGNVLEIAYTREEHRAASKSYFTFYDNNLVMGFTGCFDKEEEDRLVKIANEHRGRLIASGEFDTRINHYLRRLERERQKRDQRQHQ